MADLEKLALRRDRGYLVRLLLLLAVGSVLGWMVLEGLTSRTVGGCVATAFSGDDDPVNPPAD